MDQTPLPDCTLRESATDYTIELDVGDFLQTELEVTLEDRVVTVTALEIESAVVDVVSFRFDGRMEEAFTLPDDADPQHIEALYRRGTLEIRAQKRTPAGRRIVPIRSKPESVVNPDAAPC